MHALYAASRMLLAGPAEEVFVLAADMLSPVSQANFGGLRVLTDRPMSSYLLWNTS
ncbi:MAG TPA: hypothetical protein VE842_17195 [Pyrinomonadaceae bacterium]|jgi:hypothetical protein|nr:hypothetical protein [Pyrinomonadaceae bacterium]